MDITERNNQLKILTSTRGMLTLNKNYQISPINSYSNISGFSLLNSAKRLVIGRGAKDLIINDKKTKGITYTIKLPSIP